MPLSKNEIKFIRSLQQKKFRDEESLFVVEGIKLVDELINQSYGQIQDIYCTEEWNGKLDNLLSPILVNQSELERISGLKSPNQVLAVVKKFSPSEIDFSANGITLMLDSINDPGNLGTIIRTADWFGIQQIICSENSVEQYNPKVVQASMGAIFRSRIHYADLRTTLNKFLENDGQIFGAEMSGDDAFQTTFPDGGVLLMGSESHGISSDLQGLYKPITIPKIGASESLNVGMAAGILMAEWAKHKR